EQPVHETFDPIGLGTLGLEQQRGQRGAQSQRIERGEERREGNRERELSVNCPEIPEMNATGMNTADRPNAMAITAGVTSSLALKAASRGVSPCSIQRSTFSTTTIASSTTIPIASTRPNSER